MILTEASGAPFSESSSEVYAPVGRGTAPHVKHLFNQSVESLEYMALGDTAVRIIALHHIIESQALDALVVRNANPATAKLWEDVFPNRVVDDVSRIPQDFQWARMHAPTRLDWQFGSAGFNVFESVLWENAYFDTKRLKITPPITYPCNSKARAVMIYPFEKTDGNRVFDDRWWQEAYSNLKKKGYRVHHLGHKAMEKLPLFYETAVFDAEYPATIEGLASCIAHSSLALGSSTGPTWACLLSDIPQIVLESKKSPHGYWHFERCAPVLTKKLQIHTDLKCLIF